MASRFRRETSEIAFENSASRNSPSRDQHITRNPPKYTSPFPPPYSQDISKWLPAPPISVSRSAASSTTDDILATSDDINTSNFLNNDEYFMESDWNPLSETIDIGDVTMLADFWQSDDSINLSGSSSVEPVITDNQNQVNEGSGDSNMILTQTETRVTVSFHDI